MAELMLRKGRLGKHTTGCCELKDTVEGRNKHASNWLSIKLDR